MGLTCRLFILVALVTLTSAAPLEEENIKRMLEDLRVLEDLRLFEELEETLSKKRAIEVDSEVATVFKDMRVKHTMIKWCTFKIENRQKIVVDVRKDGDPRVDNKAAFNAMAETLTSEPRYILFNMRFVNAEGRKIEQIIFLFWCPENAILSAKMIYKSNKDTIFKEFIYAVNLQLVFLPTEKAELNYDEISYEVAKNAKYTLLRQ